MKELKQAFEAEHHGSTVSISIGSSVNLETQIENGAPFDVFLSADVEQPQKLIHSGKAEANSFFVYAQGILALLVPKKNAEILNLQSLNSERVRKIAIANPEHAPYGRAAVAALKAAKLYDKLQAKIVMGENVAQAAQFVVAGNADAGIVSMSAKGLEGVVAYPVNPSLYPPIRQGAVLTKAGADNAAAKQFLEFMRSEKAISILQRHGLQSTRAIFKPVAGEATQPAAQQR
jgi:molybdate transport system substrate-binding protein